MPRTSRLDASGILHHVIIRGIEKRSIFTSITDRLDFVKRCARLFPESTTACYAWALLSNHAHLLLRTGTVPLSTVMARLLSGYAVSFNKRHKRAGHLFQNRYRSVICQEDTYFKELVRYIHLNPLRAGLVPDVDALGTYRWSGHAALLKRKECPWQDLEYVLSIFGNDKAYLRFIEKGIDQGQRPDLTGGGLVRSNGGWREIKKSQSLVKGDERILGDSSFVLNILAQAEEKLEHRYALRKAGIDITTIEQQICDLFGLEVDQLYTGSRYKQLVEARSLFCYWAHSDLGISGKDLSVRFSISEPAVSYAIRRGQHIARQRGYQLTAERKRREEFT
ncbi:MAG: Transposase IS200 like protein [Syntrophorhabdus sp. PtaU1.Bin050]|nr:MAG: Transposase IS200 like protein [Syntrophorhabdus sp. PtaU1.Bin050]